MDKDEVIKTTSLFLKGELTNAQFRSIMQELLCMIDDNTVRWLATQIAKVGA